MHTDLFASPTDERPASTPWGAGAQLGRRVQRCWHALRQWPVHSTLKARLVLGGMLALWLSICLTAWTMASVAEVELLAQADRREQAEVLAASRRVGRRVQELQRALQLTAASIDAATLFDPALLAAHFERRLLLRSNFSTLFVARPDGSLLLLIDSAGVRSSSFNLASRDYFQRTLAERRALMSEAVAGRGTNEAVVVFTQPLLHGPHVQAVLGGTLRLDNQDLLQRLADGDRGAGALPPAGGDTAPLTVITDASGRILMHPQRTMLLQPLLAEPRLAQAHGHITVPPDAPAGPGPVWRQGTEHVAMVVEPLSGWQVWRAGTHQSALAPLQAAWRGALALGVGLALVLTALLCGFVIWQLRPLAQLQQRAEGLLQGDLAAFEGWPAADGEIGQLSRTLRHVSVERAQVEAFNTQVMQRLGSVMAASPVGLAFSRHGRFELVSAELCALLQRSEADLVGQPTQLIFASNEDYAQLGLQVDTAFASEQPYVGEWRLLRADGSSFWSQLRARPVSPTDRVAGTIWSASDISEQVQQREQLLHAAQHDALTGVLNRHGFERALQPLFKRYASNPVHSPPAVVVMIDLDNFKPINDGAGHAAGDAMLVAVARCIAAQVRGSDALARLGGDEFALLLPGCELARGLEVAEKVREALSQLALLWDRRTWKIGASLGVASLSPGHASAADWLSEADAACYEAKRSGRNAVCGKGGPAARPPAGLRVVA